MKKRIISAVISGILMAGVATCVVPQLTVTAQAATKVGTVNGNNVNLRQGPGTGYKSLAKLKKGTKVTVLDKTKGWYKVKYNNITGYISTEYVDAPGFDYFDDFILPYSKTGTVKVGTSLNVRKAPDRTSQSIGSLKNGAKVAIVGRSVDLKWYKIKFNGGYGFVSADYVKVA